MTETSHHSTPWRAQVAWLLPVAAPPADGGASAGAEGSQYADEALEDDARLDERMWPLRLDDAADWQPYRLVPLGLAVVRSDLRLECCCNGPVTRICRPCGL